MIIGIDTGGTFTDLIYQDGKGWGVHKVISTPDDPARAVLEGLAHIAPKGEFRVVHGSTVATNAILERKGARTALITNAGFEDVIEIGRQNRPNLYQLHVHKVSPLVPFRLRFGADCRADCRGRVLRDLDEPALEILVEKVRKARPQAAAVCLLFAFLNPDHERRIARALASMEIPVSLSHEVLAEFREFERTSTTVINAYVLPKMAAYLRCLATAVGEDRLRIMQSNGGAISAGTAMREPVRTILSGPAGGAVAALEIGRAAGYERLITFDMGGTSTDVALMDGRLSMTTESEIGGHPVKVPMIAIHTVGAGGGSIAVLDAGGALKVGPRSAGADPGPICYGRGEHITVTDANLFLGRLSAGHFLGGRMALHPGRLAPFFDRLARRAGLTTRQLAEGVLAVANAAMERAIRLISVEKGYDPREFTLLSFGGAGGLHAVFLARLLGIPRVLVPSHPGLLSAMGMVMADVVKDYSRTVMQPLAEVSAETLARAFQPLAENARTDLAAEGIAPDRMGLERLVDMRYTGQSHELTVSAQGDIRQNFQDAHTRTYGHADSRKAVEIVNLRLRASGATPKPGINVLPPADEAPSSKAVVVTQSVIFDGCEVSTPFLDRDRLAPGNCIQGPAVVVEYSSTIVIPPEAAARVDRFGNLVIDVSAVRQVDPNT